MVEDGSFPPVVDLKRWTKGSRVERLAVARQVEQIFLSVGFCQIINHEKEQLALAAFPMMERLFSLPFETKMGIAKAQSPHFRGFEGVMAEVTNGKADFREQVDTWTVLFAYGR